jgi:hypothetical protein
MGKGIIVSNEAKLKLETEAIAANQSISTVVDMLLFGPHPNFAPKTKGKNIDTVPAFPRVETESTEYAAKGLTKLEHFALELLKAKIINNPGITMNELIGHAIINAREFAAQIREAQK